MRVASLVTVFGVLSALPAMAEEAPKSVVELFTSQGCSSCPPADRLASEIAREGRALVLTLPVDYWDYLGWKDTLASPAHSARQRAYAMTRGDRKVYTPQIVVNGREAELGGDHEAVGAAIARAESGGGLPLPVTLKIADGRIEVDVLKSKRPLKETRGEVWAFAIQRSRPVEIGRGENAGRSVTYANVVRHMTRLGVWDGQQAHFDVAADEVMRPEADGVAVLVQAGSGGQPSAIIGAARSDSAPPLPAATIARMPRDPY